MRLCRKIAAFVLIVGIIAPSGLFHFVSDLPQIVAHYEHHNKEHESVSFAEFLVEHAIRADHPDAQHPEHDGFPFHHHHTAACCPSFVTAVLPGASFYEFHFVVPEAAENSRIHPNNAFSLSEFASSIWQPPQV